MGIEQLDNERYAREKQKKKEQKETLDFFETKKLKVETSKLLQSLAAQIAEEFGMDIIEVKNIISSSTLGGLDELKTGISNNENINLDDFRVAINSAKGKIEELSRNSRESLKNSLENDKYTPDTYEYKISKNILPKNILQKAYNPQNFGDQLIGAGVGLFDSTEAVILFTYALGKGILLTPYHIYLLITGQGEYEGFQEV